jgi:hypothetical protein
LKGARIGKIDKNLQQKMNAWLVLSRQEAVRLAHPLAIWIAHTKGTVRMFNDSDFQDKIRSGQQHFRMVAYHTSATDIRPSPGIDDRKILYQTTKKRGGTPTHIDLAIGTRISCVQNLGTQIGDLLFTLHDKFNIYYLLFSIPFYFTQEYIMAQRVPLLVLHLQVQFL